MNEMEKIEAQYIHDHYVGWYPTIRLFTQLITDKQRKTKEDKMIEYYTDETKDERLEAIEDRLLTGHTARYQAIKAPNGPCMRSEQGVHVLKRPKH